MYIKSHAKINLSLNVVGKRKDGYHELDMVMLPINLSDLIDFSYLGKNGNTHVVCNKLDYSLTPKTNIARVVVDKMREKYKFEDNFDIKIEKEIPMCAGLGGGSSNAAAVFTAIKNCLKLNISDEEAVEFLKGIGSDVPFFYFDKPARVQGVGEKITPINIKKKYAVIIIKPNKGLSTKDVYDESDECNLPVYDIDNVVKALETGDDELLSKSIGNALTEPAIHLLPEIQNIIDTLKGLGLKNVLMSGSGSSVFAISSRRHELLKAAFKLDKLGYEIYGAKVVK